MTEKSTSPLLPIRTVLMSLSNTEGLESLLTGLTAALYAMPSPREKLPHEPSASNTPRMPSGRAASHLTIVATSGTYAKLRPLCVHYPDITLQSIEQYTGAKEVAGGIVKTLHYKVFLGILAITEAQRHDADAVSAMLFDMVVVNLYPFTQMAAGAKNIADLRAGIDIGGSALLRAAAKNFERVVALHTPLQYAEFISHLKYHGGKSTLPFRQQAAAAVFNHTAQYDNEVHRALTQFGGSHG